MARANWLADKLREYGCKVVEIDGWKTRGSSVINPQVLVTHHTASNANSGDAPALGICINGRKDLAGPLANVLISRSGIVYVIASGRANNAGLGSFRGVSGNSNTIGIEAENNGIGEPWGYDQLVAYDKCAAAILDGMGRGPDWMCGHKDWTTRKIDPAGIITSSMRHNVALHMLAKAAGKVTAAAPKPVPQSNLVKRGDRGPRVWEIQNILRFWGFIGLVDGIFLGETEQAVKNFQSAIGASPDGIWGPATEKKYNEFVAYMQALNNAAKSRPVLRIGATGEQVRYLQERLRAHGYAVSVDGVYGPNTQSAVMKFQRAKGTGVDAVVGPITWRLLG